MIYHKKSSSPNISYCGSYLIEAVLHVKSSRSSRRPIAMAAHYLIAAYQGIIPRVMEGWSGGLVTMQITTSIMQV
jgi:hypothetical protein